MKLKCHNETALVKQCLQWLQMRGIMCWRNNSGLHVSEYKGKKRAIRFGAVGSPDILGILPGGRLLAVECKVGKNRLSEFQENWLDRAREAGAKAIVAYTIDDLVDSL